MPHAYIQMIAHMQLCLGKWNLQFFLHVNLYIFINACRRFFIVIDSFSSVSNVFLISTYLEGKGRS